MTSNGERPIRIAPSVLSADFTRLADEVAEVEAGGADLLHVDVMDGHFVPNLTIGVPVVKHLKRVTALPLDVHLMIDNPWDFVAPFAEAGADSLSVHIELDNDRIARTLDDIRQRGVKATIVINPDTPVESVAPVLDTVDMVLVMSVHPGFGGQSFMPEVLPKVSWLRDRLGAAAAIQIDGGIGPETVVPAAEAGADVFVAGTAVFGAPDRRAAMQAIRDGAAAGRARRLSPDVNQ